MIIMGLIIPNTKGFNCFSLFLHFQYEFTKISMIYKLSLEFVISQISVKAPVIVTFE